MISKQAMDEARARGVQKTLERYKLAAPTGMLSTLGNAATRAFTSGSKAMSHGGGSMMQNAQKGLAAGSKAFQRAGGVQAGAKTLGAGAAVGAGMYGAGAAFGAGQKSANLVDEATGVLIGSGAGLIPGGTAAMGAFRGAEKDEPFVGAARGFAGGAAGQMAGAHLAPYLGNPAIARLVSMALKGGGAHLATRDYTQQ